MRPFRPVPGGTVNIDVSSSSQAVKVSEAKTCNVEVVNDGTATVWIRAGGPSVTATTAAGHPVRSGTAEVLTFVSADGSPIYVAAIAAGSTGKIYFTPGVGV